MAKMTRLCVTLFMLQVVCAQKQKVYLNCEGKDAEKRCRMAPTKPASDPDGVCAPRQFYADTVFSNERKYTRQQLSMIKDPASCCEKCREKPDCMMWTWAPGGVCKLLHPPPLAAKQQDKMMTVREGVQKGTASGVVQGPRALRAAPATYALEISGGFRTMGFTFWTLLGNVVKPNGGPRNVTICAHANVEDAMQSVMGEMIVRHHPELFSYAAFERVSFGHAQNYLNHPGTGKTLEQHFAQQLYAIARAHEGCAGATSNATTFFRVRPDCFVSSPVDLGYAASIVRPAFAFNPGCRVQQCKRWGIAGRDQRDRSNDQFLFASRVAMDALADLATLRNATTRDCCEQFFGTALCPHLKHATPATMNLKKLNFHGALLDHPFVSSWYFEGAYHTQKHHATCGRPSPDPNFRRLFASPVAQAVVLHSFAVYYGHFARK